MTTIRVSMQEWEIPTVLENIRKGLLDTQELLSSLSEKFERVEKAQRDLKSMCIDIADIDSKNQRRESCDTKLEETMMPNENPQDMANKRPCERYIETNAGMVTPSATNAMASNIANFCRLIKDLDSMDEVKAVAAAIEDNWNRYRDSC